MTREKMILMAAVFAVIAAAIVFAVTRNRAGGVPDISGDDHVMLIEYCRKTVATVGGNGYSKTVLYRNSDGSCEVHYYSRHDGDSSESHTSKPADPSVVGEAYALISDCKMRSWNEKYSMPGPDGVVYSLMFLDDSGEYVRVSSDRMPDDGISMMLSVAECLNRGVQQ